MKGKTLEERIRNKQYNYKDQIVKLNENIARLDKIFKKLFDEGIEGLEINDIQFLRRHSVEINTDPTIY